MGVIYYNGVSSMDIHALVQHPPEYAFPERDYTITHIPGRNGDVIIDSGSWKNVERKYDMAIDARKEDYVYVAGWLVQWLYSAKGYGRLEDSYEPEYYRMATYKDSGEISNLYNKAGVIEIAFECKPQRYLKSGEISIRIDTSDTSVYNRTAFIAKPKIIVYGASGEGTIEIGAYHMDILNVQDGMIIDCETEDVYMIGADNNHVNLNNTAKISVFPNLLPGDNIVKFTGNITAVDVIPRWWIL